MATTSHPPVGLVATHSIDFVRQVLSLLDEGRVVVPLRSVDDSDRMSRTGATEVREPKPEFGWATFSYTPRTTPDTAQFLFTSGTEGLPKGVELPHAALADVVARLNDVMQLDDTIREYVGIPVYHSFGFGRCRAVAAAGGRAFLPEHGFDPLQVAEMLGKGEINAISAVPSLWRVLLDARSMFEDIGAGVRWIEIGSQYMSREEKLAVRELFPNAKIVQHYGLTEASRSTFLEIHGTEGEHLESVGRAYGDVEVALTDDGRIKIRGPHVASQLWIEGEPRPAVDDLGWYETNDLGSLRDGYLYFGGRADDVINCGGLKLAPELLETRVRELQPDIGEFSIARMPDPVRGDGILISITAADQQARSSIEGAVAEAAAAHGVNARGAIATQTVTALPRTASGKVQRRKLTEQWVEAHPAPKPSRAAAPAPTAAAAPTARSAREAELRAIWQEALGTDDIGLDESFYDLGGDSLTALNVIMRMGRAGIEPAICRSIFQGATIADLVTASMPEPEPEPSEDPRSAKEAELQAIWREALGTEDIGTEESFYDLGGDSLTALNVIMRMGRAGIEPAICRSIFQGATIRDLVKAAVPEAPAAPAGPSQTDALRAREAELEEIWKEALGTDDIATNESFYDLGGDSLTALNVIMRMGRAGIDATICRSIFQGATIAELARASVPTTPDPPTGDDRTQREAELAEIWKEALGTDDIATNESFYDLGGDSLTALNVIMRMGRAGIEPAICRSIFQGATIADLAKAASEASAPKEDLPTPQTPEAAKKTIGGINVGYANNIMVNAVRGILILAVILGHWSVGLFDRLPESLSIIKKVMSPFFLFGTPGFAVTFGVGFGYLQLPIYERNPARVKKSLRTGVLLVGSGAVVLGLLGAAAQVFVRKVPFDDHVFFVSFFTPLTFYAIAVASIPAWFSVITKLSKTPKERIRLLLGMAAASYSLQMVLDVALADVKVRGFLQLLRLLLEAKFAYFDMMSLVFVGLALGTWIKHEGMRDDAPKAMGYAALAVLGSAVAFGLATGEIVELTYWPSKNCLTKWSFFAGLVMLTISALMALTRRYSDLSPRGRMLLNAVSTVGQLSLPFYMLQSLPVPIKSVLQLVGVPGPVALLIALGLFAGVSYLMVRRVYAMFHN